MYGVPANLDLSQFHGTDLQQIALGEYEIQFRFGSGRLIGVESGWQLRAPDGTRVDGKEENAKRTAYRVHVLIGRTVTGSEVHSPRSFVLRFDTGHTLEIMDDDARHESFSIQPGDIFV